MDENENTEPEPSRRRRTLCRGPLEDLEAHLHAEWWGGIFNKLYLLTDAELTEDDGTTRSEVDTIVKLTGLEPDQAILDLCCGQGRHSLELARRGYRNITGVDQSRFLIRTARARAKQLGLPVTFRAGDARDAKLAGNSLDAVLMLGNSFGYFTEEEEDARLLDRVGRLLKQAGTLVMEIGDGDWLRENFHRGSWEWLDGDHFMCRERALSRDGDRLLCREIIVERRKGVVADQIFAMRLYSRDRIISLLRAAGYRDVQYHGPIGVVANPHEDYGTMARRALVVASAPRRSVVALPGARGQVNVAVLLGDPRLPDATKPKGHFAAMDSERVHHLKLALASLRGFRFRYLDDHGKLPDELTAAPTDLVLNLCDEGFGNDPLREAHVPALLEMLGLPYTGAGPAALTMCYDKGAVRVVAAGMGIPVPEELLLRPGDPVPTVPFGFPVLLKPNLGDGSVNITAANVVRRSRDLPEAIRRLRRRTPGKPLLVQEFLEGEEFSVGLIGNPETGLRALPVLWVDYGALDGALPRLLGYEAKAEPDSAFWRQIEYRPAPPDARRDATLVEASRALFERLGCRDYARMDFRLGADGVARLLEVNPNPGWAWDAKMNLMAGFESASYARMLGDILEAAMQRHGLARRRGRQRLTA